MGWSILALQQNTTTPRLKALLRTRRPLTQAELKAWQAHGVAFSYSEHKILSLDSFYPITVLRFSALRWLEGNPLVERVDLSSSPFGPPHLPLQRTSQNTQAAQALQEAAGRPHLTGEGQSIGLIDSGIDVFHPAFFHANGGYFAWLDTDQDGKLTPGKDGVDLNGNGVVDKNEVLRCLRARYYSRNHQTIDPDPTLQCRAGQDWLYLDSNGNKTRDFGPKNQFKESDPTYGERLFVIDDVNQNGRLDPKEKIVALGTSKIKAVWFRNKTYYRGKDLYQTPVTPSINASAHGTQSAGVLVGGQPGFTQMLGIAPNASLFVAVSRSTNAKGQIESNIEEALIWMLSQKVGVVLHEYSQWLGKSLDGTSNHEKVLDTGTKQNILQVVPVGNLGAYSKHMLLDVPAGSTESLPIEVNWPKEYPPGYRPFQQVYLSLLWHKQTSADIRFTLLTPDGKRIPLLRNNPRGQIYHSSLAVYSAQSTSERETTLMAVSVFGYKPETKKFLPLPQGTWKLEVRGDSKQAIRLHGYIGDEQSSWGKGVRFTQNVSDQFTVCWPATSDSALGVSAYTGYSGTPYSNSPEQAGDIRAFSSAGPRIDGKQVVWLAAPDNPITATSPLLAPNLPPIGHGSYLVYGGTSGASPHVAAAAALLQQLHPDWSPQQIKESFQKGALVDSQVGSAPNRSWGHGKLRIYRTLFQKDPASNQAPSIQYNGAEEFYQGKLPSTLAVVLSDPESPEKDLRVQWDPNYSGKWSTAYRGKSIPLPKLALGLHLWKVRVLDPQGASASLLIKLRLRACLQASDCGAGFRCNQGKCQPKSDKDSGNQTEPGPQPTEPLGCQCESNHSAPTPLIVLLLCILLFTRILRNQNNDEPG